MKRKIACSLLTLVVLVGASLMYTQNASSSSANQHIAVPRALPETSNLMPVSATTFTVDRADDTAGATACTAAANDCSLRGAIIAANANGSANPVIINLQAATTYNLTLTNATQENAAATGDLDITTTLHTVTIMGGGSSGPSATIIDASGLNTGSVRDRAFHITGSGVNVTFQDLVIQNGRAADNGTSGASTNPTAQNTNRFGGGILNNGGSVTLTNVTVNSCQALGKGDTVLNDHTTLDALGGGLASLGVTGNVIITGSTFTDDSAVGGNGANFNNGNASNAKGGSIYFEGGTLNIDGSRFLLSSAHGGLGGDSNASNQENGGAGGSAQGGGAWIGGGTVSINNSTFESCAATGGNAGPGQNSGNFGGESGGGGLYSLGSVTVTNSTFDLDSSTGGRGGDSFGPNAFGAHNAEDGGAARGGAILADGGSLIIDTATFANNSANGGNGGDGGETNGAGGQHGAGGLAYGGAITNNNAATINIKHGTISGNNAQAGNSGVNQGGANRPARLVAEGTGGGIRVGPGSVTLENTIIAVNTAANGAGNTTGAPTPGPNVDGPVTSNGHNLLGVATEATGFTGTGDQTGANPMLAALADNGGPTRTMALSAGSPAIDAGVAAGASFDQRGLARTYDDVGVPDAATSDGTDIGAFELQPTCSLTCPGDVSVSNDTDQCGAIVNYTAPSGAACGTVTCDHPSGSFFDVGTTMVTCTSSTGPTCAFNVTVNDTQDPTITAPAGFTVDTDSNSCMATGVSLGAPTTSDNCLVSPATNDAPGTFPLGPTTVTWTVTDNHGHTATATQVITVVDNTPPSLTVPADSSAFADASCQAAIPDVVSGSTASDNCGAVTITQSPVAGTLEGLGAHTITVKATDAAGNHTEKTVTFTVIDNTPPSLTVPADPSAFANASCQAAIPDVSSSSTASDNCGAVTITQSPTAGTLVGLGAHTITVKATDAASNHTEKTVTFTVTDNTPPSLTVPADSSAFANASCQALIPNVVSGSTASDNCGAVTITQSPAAGTVVGLGAHSITVKATDAAGNHTDKTVTFTVIDNTPPTITLNGNVITLWPPDHRYETVQVSDLVAGASDNCDASVNLSSVYISQVTSDEAENGDGDGNTFNDIVIAADCRSVQLRAERAGNGNGRVYTIIFKVTDASGNFATVTAKVTVPHSQDGSAAVDDGPHYTVLSDCP
jgi:hypothetical protein